MVSNVLSFYRNIHTFFKNILSRKGFIISISINGLLKSCARFIVERSEI